MTSLYELTQEMLRLQTELDECVQEDGSIDAPDELIGKYISFDTLSEDKVEGVIRFIENLEIEAATRKAEYQALTKAIDKHRIAARTAENKIARLKQFVLWHMTTIGKPEIKTATHKIKICANGGNPSVNIPSGPIDFKFWPEGLYEMVPTPDTDAIRDAAAAGKPLPPGVEVIRGQHIRIS